jgi:hypothetical protein
MDGRTVPEGNRRQEIHEAAFWLTPVTGQSKDKDKNSVITQRLGRPTWKEAV